MFIGSVGVSPIAAAQGAVGSGDGLEEIERELRERQAVEEEKAARAREAARRIEEKRAAEARAREKAEAAQRAKLLHSRSEYGEMVLIPAGDFYMGCNDLVDRECDEDERPGRKVSLGAYFIDRTEVTTASYGACVSGGGCSEPGTFRGCNWQATDRDRHPINCVDWTMATEFCRWSGKRLPTEQEWEKAARGSDGLRFPWGTDDDVVERANLLGAEDGYVGTSPVGSFPAGDSPYGVFDLAGNVWEWTSDASARGRSIRGGGWNNVPRSARASFRNWNISASREADYGFRCARSS
ncbi:formylglycine-generating enzyme family protein [Myxococcota bacterium]|nr:formylglycine-generating enzyme family protein [Myxococcota bacterium]